MTFNSQAVSQAEAVVTDDAIKILAGRGDAEAELQMGMRYTSFAWGGKDDKVAVKWFAKAAQQGQAEAQYRYGMGLLEGRGIIQDYKAAISWLEKSARQGYPEAQFATGELYRDGVGTVANAERAYLWFNLAAAQGLDKAASARDLVIKLLSPGQITAIQEEAGRISRNQQPTSPQADTPKTAVPEAIAGKVNQPSMPSALPTQ